MSVNPPGLAGLRGVRPGHIPVWSALPTPRRVSIRRISERDANHPTDPMTSVNLCDSALPSIHEVALAARSIYSRATSTPSPMRTP